MAGSVVPPSWTTVFGGGHFVGALLAAVASGPAAGSAADALAAAELDVAQSDAFSVFEVFLCRRCFPLAFSWGGIFGAAGPCCPRLAAGDAGAGLGAPTGGARGAPRVL